LFFPYFYFHQPPYCSAHCNTVGEMFGRPWDITNTTIDFIGIEMWAIVSWIDHKNEIFLSHIQHIDSR